MRRAAALAAALAGLSAPAAGQLGEEASFVSSMGVDTFAVESFVRAPGVLEGELRGRSLGRLAYRLEAGGAGTPRVLTLRAWAPGASEGSDPAQSVRVEMVGDSAIVEIATPAGSQTQRFASRAGALPYFNPSFALTEEAVREVLGRDDEGEVALFLLQGGQTLPARISREGTDSVMITIAGSRLRAGVDADGRLLGGTIPGQNLSFVRVAGRVPYTAGVQPPDYSAPADAPYRAEEVTVPTPGGHTLAGTLTLPPGEGPFPAVVTATGSGPQDRDQALPNLPGYRPFREIADTLSRRGIAVLRLDDRGTGASTGDFATATTADFADDLRAALAYLRARPDVDDARLAVVGHSEGGLIGPMVAADDPELRALVSIAGPAWTGRRIIDFQQREAIGRLPGLTPEGRDSALTVARAELAAAAERQPWIAFFLDHDPLPVARRVVGVPVLILHGETDLQVTVDQAEVLAAAVREGGNPDVTVRVFPELNHLLLADPVGDPSGYASLTHREVDRELLGVLADWLDARLR